MPKYYDISVAISSTVPVWEGDPAVRLERVMKIEEGDPANVTRMDMGAHTATHVDAPCHFVQGRKGADQLELDTLIGPALVVAFDVENHITAADFEGAAIPPGTTRLLLKTRNSRLWEERGSQFDMGFVGVSADGAQWLVDNGVKLVGVDYLGVERVDSVNNGAPVHHTLLSAELIILEGLNLIGIEPGQYTLLCLPVKITGADGSPARAVLVK